MKGSPPATCYCCGKPLAADHLSWRYPLPDVVAELSKRQASRRIDVNTDAVITAEGLGSFIRVLLPIPMDTGRLATVGVWLKIGDAETFHRVMEAGNAGGEAWLSLSFEGKLANAVHPWPEVYHARAVAAVPGEDIVSDGGNLDSLAVPRIVRTDHPLLARLLTEPWSQEQFLRSRPS